MRNGWWVIVILSLCGCGDRSTPGVEDGATADQQVVDGGQPVPDMSRPDRRVDTSPPDLPPKPDASKKPDAAAPLSHCQGATYAHAGGSTLAVSKVVTSTNVVASCCGPGEVMVFKTVTASGKPLEISLQVARFPGVSLGPKVKVDLAKPPKGWYFGVYCNPSSVCGIAHTTTHDFKGYLEYQSLLGAPAVQVTVCLDATPNNPTNPYKHPLRLWASKVLVNKACVPKMDQTCNYDPKISSLRGTCNDDSTCTCNPGAKKMANGKCS